MKHHNPKSRFGIGTVIPSTYIAAHGAKTQSMNMTKAEAQMLLAQPDLSAAVSPEAIANLKKGLDMEGNPLVVPFWEKVLHVLTLGIYNPK